jgi:hemoglobin/transferrin/lactoferrin receptor protein
MALTAAVQPSQAAPAASGAIVGVVLDQTGLALVGAGVALTTPANAEIARTRTDSSGMFRFDGVPAATYVFAVQHEGFASHRQPVTLAAGETMELVVRLQVGVQVETVTVTPLRGEPRSMSEIPEFVTVISSSALEGRSCSILPQAFTEEAGVHLQQTTASQGSLFVRGLTGQHVVSLIDGVRFNTSTFRPGANQYVALIEPLFVDRVEVVHGPTSTQYGSDALGGVFNIVTRPSIVDSTRPGAAHGMISAFLGTADLSAGGGAFFSTSGERWGVSVGATGRRVQDLRAGGGKDSHSVATRLLGLPPDALGTRLQDTAYTQSGASARGFFRPGSADLVTLEYLRGLQRGGRRYDQLNGGLGNLIAGFDPQVLDFASVRLERLAPWRLDSLSSTLSFNAQRDDRESQSINNASSGLRSPITTEANRTAVVGWQMQATATPGARHRIAFGSELYDERISSRRQERRFDGASGDCTGIADLRARFPNGASYRTFAVFAQDAMTLLPDRLTATIGARHSAFRYHQSPDDNPVLATGPSVPDFTTTFADLTYDAGLVWSVSGAMAVTARAGRGFRAPNVNDFGSIGVSGLGFEISPDEGERAGARSSRIGATASRTDPVRQLRPEVMESYEAGLKLHTRAASATLSIFGSEISNFIERRTVLLDAGAVGTLLAGQPIVRQDASGAVYTSLSNSPVFVRANSGRVRFFGYAATLKLQVRAELSASGSIGYTRATDVETGQPPGLENGIPPASGHAGLRWDPVERPYWAEIYTRFAWPQPRLSGNDLAQARIGGIRTRQEIANFFNNGAVVRGLVLEGRLVATGETLDEVLKRVLGDDPGARVPMYAEHAGYVTLNLRAGWDIAPGTRMIAIAENLLDRNYRTMGSGVDAPGVNIVVRITTVF